MADDLSKPRSSAGVFLWKSKTRELPDAGDLGYDAVVIGGGAAGFFGAISCAATAPGARVLIVEKTRRLLSKVRISGGGRCNVTHACFEPAALITRYPRGQRELRGAFHRWQPEDTVRWFEQRGVALKTEPDGRMFPVTDDSASIVDCLTDEAGRLGVDIQTGMSVEGITTGAGGARFSIAVKGQPAVHTRTVLIATGGMKTDAMRTIIEGFGHTIQPLAPSLFTFNIPDSGLNDLAGVSVEDARVTIPDFGYKTTGPVLLTHWGLSGPAVLKLSALAARELASAGYRFDCQVNWTGAKEAVVLEKINNLTKAHGRKAVRNHAPFKLPSRLWRLLLERAGVDGDTLWSQLPKVDRQALVGAVCASTFAVSGKSMNKEEFVTCGGVSLDEVDMRCFESRKVPGLFFAGEVLDIDGVTGGFNFQAAWTGGLLAGRAMAEVINDTTCIGS